MSAFERPVAILKVHVYPCEVADGKACGFLRKIYILLEKLKISPGKIAFLQYLKQQPAYTAEQNIGFALQLASEAQLQQQYSLAADIYSNTARRFNLNPQIRDLCENKVAKLRLINETAPPIAALDIAKQRVDISSYRGKVLLIDVLLIYIKYYGIITSNKEI